MSLADSYRYEVELDWTGARAGVLRAQGFPPLDVSAPLEFSGQAGVWTPEHLLAGATASCLMTTFLAIAALSKLEVLGFRLKGHALLEKVEKGYRFTAIRLFPEITLARTEDVEKAQRVVEKAEKHCFISQSLVTAVEVEPRFVVASVEMVR